MAQADFVSFKDVTSERPVVQLHWKLHGDPPADITLSQSQSSRRRRGRLEGSIQTIIMKAASEREKAQVVKWARKVEMVEQMLNE